MKFSLTWLKRYLDTDASLSHICDTLTAIGLEVEDVQDRAALYAPFKVAYVEHAEKHPQADRLKVCNVQTANGTLQVVCGAPNARTGMKAIFAPEASMIPGLDNLVLKKSMIRGVESNGMLVSEREMCLSDESDGIIEVDAKWPVGTPMAEIFGLQDPIIEINLTPNRADCAGVYGIARDLAAAGIGKLKPLENPAVKTFFESPIRVTIEDSEGCPHFMGVMIKGVKNGPSPAWLQQLLKDAGQKSISALVDVTNYFSLGFARPLHVYDADKVKGNITVRRTKNENGFAALNDKTYENISDAVGIYDDSGLIGLGGIMGGASTGCTADTVNVFVEAAYFSPDRIARAGRDLQIISDARYRFERGIDPQFTAPGLHLALQMIVELCGGQASTMTEAGKSPHMPHGISFDPAFTKHLIGMDIPAKDQYAILHALGFTGKNQITVPSWRGDIHGKADLVEEIFRITGFDALPAQSVTPAADAAIPELPTGFQRSMTARAALAARGLQECMTWSFLKSNQARDFGLSDDQISTLTLTNPISADLDVMRPSLLPHLITSSIKSAAQGFEDTAFFEVGPAFSGTAPEDQITVAAGIRAGHAAPRHWADANAARPVDAFDAKADAIAALEALGAPTNMQISRNAPAHYHPGRSGAFMLGKSVLAYFGEIHPALSQDNHGRLVGFEVFLDAIPAARRKDGTAKTLLKLEALQPLSRDFAFVVKADIAADDVVRAARNADKNLITAANIFDVYTGTGVPEGHKSIALAITLQPREKTLTETEIDAVCKAVIAEVTKKTGGQLRQ